MQNLAERIRKDLRIASDPGKVRVLQRFFKTGPGQYGEGDVFIGVMVPESRKIAKAYADSVGLPTIKQLLGSPVHEERLVALLMLVIRNKTQGTLTAKFYLQNLDRVNSWDLVDLSAPSILGPYLAGCCCTSLQNQRTFGKDASQLLRPFTLSETTTWTARLG